MGEMILGSFEAQEHATELGVAYEAASAPLTPAGLSYRLTAAETMMGVFERTAAKQRPPVICQMPSPTSGMEPAWPSRTAGWPRSVVMLEGPGIYGRSSGITMSLTTDTT